MIDMHSPASRTGFERERQQAVERSGVLERGGDSELQRIVDRAARLFDTPMAAMSIIDRDRQWFAARNGPAVQETPRSLSFCAHAIHRPGEILVVADARLDARFAQNPAVVHSPHVRFYAGVPLVDRAGYPLGALCVIDQHPRPEPANLFELFLLAREAERLVAR